MAPVGAKTDELPQVMLLEEVLARAAESFRERISICTPVNQKVRRIKRNSTIQNMLGLISVFSQPLLRLLNC